MDTRYEHTQTGYGIISVITAGLVFITGRMVVSGFSWIGLATLLVLAAVLALFYSLTVTITDTMLFVQFGSGGIGKKFRIRDIDSCRRVKTPWYYGWGIRLIPRGLLYAVSGVRALEIRMKNGRIYPIGTDAPAEFEKALQEAIKKGLEGGGAS
ncbi:hypothetical protein [Chitinivibrio alkaliphilus]|uniref:Bacterial Pleckstrin homology domain-containing protein n=1 Tax=Chitinivibrio alkaliphilus ACht1 TaxID=1313304 RepID=U7D9Z1_9BACT|nr:hypothetical protein [Chitinivibrio alkaliphilus]ERP39224.1 hypothetical protein CALK_0009 [Chitinivibrio alkaliphilus ACht1]